MNEAVMAANPRTPDRIMRGTAVFISITTPEREVKVDEPVKFIVRKAEIGGRRKRKAATDAQPEGESSLRRRSNSRCSIRGGRRCEARKNLKPKEISSFRIKRR